MLYWAVMTVKRAPSRARRGGTNWLDFMMFLLVWSSDRADARRDRKKAPLIPVPRTKSKRRRKGANTGGGGSGGSSHTGVGPADGVFADKAEASWWTKHTKTRTAREDYKPYYGIDLEAEEEAQVIDPDDPDYVHEMEIDPDEEETVEAEMVDGVVVDDEDHIFVDLDDRPVYGDYDPDEGIMDADFVDGPLNEEVEIVDGEIVEGTEVDIYMGEAYIDGGSGEAATP